MQNSHLHIITAEWIHVIDKQCKYLYVFITNTMHTATKVINTIVLIIMGDVFWRVTVSNQLERYSKLINDVHAMVIHN